MKSRRKGISVFLVGLLVLCFTFVLSYNKEAEAQYLIYCEMFNRCAGSFACNSNTMPGGLCLAVGIGKFAVCVGACPNYCVSIDTYETCSAFASDTNYNECDWGCDGCTGGSMFQSANSCLGVANCGCTYTIPAGDC